MTALMTRPGQARYIAPCPSWCDGDHFDSGLQADGRFHSRWLHVPLGEGTFAVQVVCNTDTPEPGDVNPTRLTLDGCVEISPAQAQSAANVILTAVALAADGASA